MTKRQKYYLQYLQENLRLFPVQSMSLYSPGLGGAVLPRAGEPFRYFLPEEVNVVEARAPTSSAELEAIIEARVPTKQALVNNFILGMREFNVKNKKININIFKSDYRHWKGTLPQADNYDFILTREGMHTPFNTASIAISKDNSFFTPRRTNRRASHIGDLCLLNGMKYERDLGEDTQSFEELIRAGTGQELFLQNKSCVARQLNIPLEGVKSTQMMGIVSSEPAIADYGFHAAFLTQLNMTAEEVIECANELYGSVGPDDVGRYVRVEIGAHVHPFEEEYLANFSNHSIDTMAVTMQPILWLAGANEFGEAWLENLPHVMRNSRKR